VDAGTWLRKLGLGRYEQAFRDNDVDAAVLPQLTAEDLKELGIASVGRRRKLLAAIAALGQGSAVRPPSAAADLETRGERRHVVVLFADLAGYTALSRELDAEDVHLLLGRFFERADRIIETHGGHIDKQIGDCVMAVFGAPVAHGDDAERAVRAALALRDAMPEVSAELARPVHVHVGVASGQVVASGTGSTHHRAYTVTGDTVNLASRLTGAAAAGEILLSEQVHRLLAERLHCGEVNDLAVKGYAEPVRAWRLLGLRDTIERRPFAGRRGELRRFRGALAACRDTGRGRAIHVRGEAGIGKSRLLEEVQHLARELGFLCHTALVLDFGADSDRDAIRELVRAMLGLETPDGGLVAVEDAAFLNGLLGLPQPAELRSLHDAMDHDARAAGKRRLVARLVERASRRQPRLLAVEGVRWADRPTLAYLAALTDTVATCPALLVTASRPEGDPLDVAWRARLGDRPFASLELGPLRPDEARTLARAFTAAHVPFAERCVGRAAGNPLFLEQLLGHAEEGAEAGVPGSVQSLVQARLDRLDPADKAALHAASVLGLRFDREALGHPLARPDYSPERLVVHALVRPHVDGFLFAHALIRDAAYGGLLRSWRRELRQRAAVWFAGRDPALHAAHLDRADDPGAPRAYLAAARLQVTEYRYESALDLARRGPGHGRE
jgi:class 3 adenylate cyclase